MKALLKLDPQLLTFPAGDGRVGVSNRFAGRIFAELGGRRVHRFDAERAAAPRPGEFNNLGGNSLWPGPEGGDFAFNYLPGTGWLVQDEISVKSTATLKTAPGEIAVGKHLKLRNRAGAELELAMRRRVRPLEVGELAARFGVAALAYRTLDEFRAAAPLPPERALFCAWSLEQFPGGDGVTAFGHALGGAAQAVNADYYGDPGARLDCRGAWFRLELGGEARFQLGLDHRSRPKLIGAWDRGRELLMLRRIHRTAPGVFFNIADNDQPRGPYSAADSYSIFNGGSLGFFELETIAPLELDGDGRGTASRLWSETMIFQGPPDRLAALLKTRFRVPASITGERS